MKFQPEFITIFLYFILVCGGAIFMYGFFPLSRQDDEGQQTNKLPTFIDDIPINRSVYYSRFNRAVLMIIDGMRRDFIFSNPSMEYTNNLINKSKACLFDIKVQPPTVTLPRIKALVSGTIPNFVDVILNLGSPQFKGDSILQQLINHQNRIVFCGDNTWTKLFPTIFHRSFENKDSLYVNDFYQGDHNITKQLNKELERNDWNLLILHYLGLDHIGHVEGPFSVKITPKLKEMDGIVEKITSSISKLQQSKLPSLFILTADHGMRDSGGHGGSSFEEIHIPLVISGANCTSSNQVYNQIDIAPTVSVLLGLPIPALSIGVIIPNFIEAFNKDEQLYALYYNSKRLMEKLAQRLPIKELRKREFYIQHNEAVAEYKNYLQLTKMDGVHEYLFKKIKLLFISSEQEMSNELSLEFVKYDLFAIIIGLTVSTITLVSITLHTLSNQMELYNLNICSKWSLAIIIVTLVLRPILGEMIGQHFGLCSNDIVSVSVLVSLIWLGFTSTQIAMFEWKKFSILEYHPLALILLCGASLHALSFASSSFIEEEHQTWYFFNETLFVILFVLGLKRKTNNGWLNAMRKDKLPKQSKFETLKKFDVEFGWMFIFLLHLFLRRLNQTGDKWRNIPDISDWLQMDENRLWNSAIAFFGIFLTIYNCIDFHSFLTSILTLTASILIYYYRAISGSVHFSGIKPSESNVPIWLFWVNILEIFCITYLPILYKLLKGNITANEVRAGLGVNITMFCLISTLLHRPHNIILNFGILFSCFMVNVTVNKLFANDLKILVQSVSYFWIGKMFFFYQGNSNSLATIDLNAGYVGLKSYNMLIVGTFLTTNTFNGFILTYFNLIYNIYIADTKNGTRNIFKALRWITWLNVLPFTFFLFMMITFRNHLFIWTIFAPKLIYESYHLILIFLISVFTVCINKIVIFLS